MALALLCGLSGLVACNPVDTWRDLTGASKNDPDPETTPNTQNLASGDASAYPNLATVPPPPTRAMTAAERDKLTQSLVADRTNAKYTDEKLRAGFSAISAPVPPPPPPPAPLANEPSAKPADKNAKPPTPQAPDVAGGQANAAPPRPSQGRRAAGARPQGVESRSAAGALDAGARSGPPAAADAAAGNDARRRDPDRRPSGSAHLPAPPAPAPLPSTVDTAEVSAAAAAAGAGAAGAARAASAGGAEKRAPPVASTAIGEFKFAGQSTGLGDGAEPDIDKVVAAYRHDPGRVRIIGYAGVGSGAAEQLASYRVALDRAQTVAAALTKAGIPADKILAEVAPAAADLGEGRAEVKLEH